MDHVTYFRCRPSSPPPQLTRVGGKLVACVRWRSGAWLPKRVPRHAGSSGCAVGCSAGIGAVCLTTVLATALALGSEERHLPVGEDGSRAAAKSTMMLQGQALVMKEEIGCVLYSVGAGMAKRKPVMQRCSRVAGPVLSCPVLANLDHARCYAMRRRGSFGGCAGCRTCRPHYVAVAVGCCSHAFTTRERLVRSSPSCRETIGTGWDPMCVGWS